MSARDNYYVAVDNGRVFTHDVKERARVGIYTQDNGDQTAVELEVNSEGKFRLTLINHDGTQTSLLEGDLARRAPLVEILEEESSKT